MRTEDVVPLDGAPAPIEAPHILRPQAVAGYQVSPFNSEGHKPRFIIKDQDGKHYVMANHIGVKLIQLFDGRHTPEQLGQHLLQQGFPITREKIEQFIDLCNANQLLVEGSWVEVTAEVAEKHKTRDKLGFYKQLFASGPMLDWLASHYRWWLNPVTLVMALVCMGAAVVFLLAPPSGAGLSAPLNQVTFQTSDLVLTLLPLIFLLEISLHELAHALACRLFGVNAGGFGFGLIWGAVPIFFTNTTDAYSIDNKYKRVLISAVGPLVDFTFLGMFALIVWNLTPGSTAYRCALAYTAFPISTLLINLNPFLIRMDGYWMLADLVEQPNLRRSAFRYLRSLVARVFGRPVEQNLLSEPIDGRWHVRLFYVVYGLIAFSWVVLFVVSFVYSIVTSMIRLMAAAQAFRVI